MNPDKPVIPQIIQSFKGKLIVSYQAYMGGPLQVPATIVQMVLAVEKGAAAAIRCQGVADISAIKGQVDVPVIGLWKEGHEGVYITPSYRYALDCSLEGADIVALDATGGQRADGLSYGETVRKLKEDKILVMADCGSIKDACRAVAAGSDIISTTLAGCTPDHEKTKGPDYQLLEQMLDKFPEVAVICEGRIHTPEQARKVMDMGAWAVGVGVAITHPTSITTWFKEAL